MKLNRKIPGLPDWPGIYQHGQEFVVRGEHLPYNTYTGLTAFPLFPGRTLCQMFFKTEAVVRFTPSQVTIDRQSYATDNGVPIQFRASRPHMKEDDYNALYAHASAGRISSSVAQRLKFRRVEMIYGSRVVHVASIEDPDRAAQYAIGLQIAYELASASQISASPSASSRTRSREDSLPE